MSTRAVVVLLTAALAGSACPAQESRPAMTRQERIRQLRRLQTELMKLFQAGDYAAAAGKCREGMKLAPRDPTFAYNLACSLARLGKADEALEALARSIQLGYAGADHMAGDEDLASLRGKPRFVELTAKARANAKRLAGQYEAGADIEGVKTVEGNPEGGLRWRLRMNPKATARKPDRLIVWMHPSGGSMNRHLEAMARGFVDRGFALLVLTQKDFRMWSGADAGKLAVSLADVAKVEGLDAARPILMGYSAGGQMALHLYAAGPARFGGYVLDAAYPIRRQGGKMKLTAPPESDDVAKAPLFVVVGDKDGGAEAWRRAAGRWRAAGAPLVVHYVPGKGHTWLFDAERTKLLHGWLEQVRDGKLPGKAAAAATHPASSPEPP